MTTAKKIIMGLSLIAPLLLNAQKHNAVIDIAKGQRLDTIIQFDKQKAFHYLPLTILKGSQDGPVFTIVARIHGYEYPPIVATQELLKELDPKASKRYYCGDSIGECGFILSKESLCKPY